MSSRFFFLLLFFDAVIERKGASNTKPGTYRIKLALALMITIALST